VANRLRSTSSWGSTVERVSVVERHIAGIHGEYGTMDPSPERFTQHHTLAVGVLPDPLNEVVSIHGWKPDRSQSFGPGVHGVARQRLSIGHFPSRSRLPHPDRTDRSPSSARRDRHVCGRSRKSLGCPVTSGTVCRVAADERPALPEPQWFRGSITVIPPAKRVVTIQRRRLLASFLPDPARKGAAVADRGICRGTVYRPLEKQFFNGAAVDNRGFGTSS
jgi:hypothetical protein